jgi:hypothetical protein
MDSSNSMLKTVIERIRGLLDDPDLEAKYNDDYLVRHIIQPAFATVTSRLNNSSTNAVMKRLTFPLAQGVADYQMPSCVGEVLRLCVLDESGRAIQEAVPRGLFNLRGPNWKVEGNLISFLPFPPEDYAYMELWYIHSGDYSSVYVSTASPSFTLDVTKKIVTMVVSTTPALGSFDRRPGAYVGQQLRLIPTTGVVEERLIDSWTHVSDSTWTATVRTAFVKALAGQIGAFEIAPESNEPLFEAVAAFGAMKMAGYRKISGEHFGIIQAQYRDAMKTLMDHYANIQMRMPKYFEKDTVDNQLTQPWRI